MGGEIHLYSECHGNQDSLPQTMHSISRSEAIIDSRSSTLDEDRDYFLSLVDHHADQRQVLVHGYVLMSNHFHLVATGQVEHGVSRFMPCVTDQYAQYLHGRLNRRGGLWQSRFYSCVLDGLHFLTALACVDLNPQRARMVERATAYRWSSAAAHSGRGGSTRRHCTIG